MDIEHLSKSQIVLLTLLVSFVTSIATGIVTVSLMDQAPPVVAETVNRVIERTIQTVASSTPVKSQPAAASVITQEKTVVVHDDDLLSQAIAKLQPSIVRVYTNESENPTLLGIGIVIDANGTVLTDATPFGYRSDGIVALADGTRVRAFVRHVDSDNSFAFLQAATSTQDKPITWTPAKISADQPVLGGSVVAVSGKTVTRIAPGIVTALLPVGGGRVIDTNIPPEMILPGSVLTDRSGALVGVSSGASRTSSPQGFIPAAVLLPPPKK